MIVIIVCIFTRKEQRFILFKHVVEALNVKSCQCHVGLIILAIENMLCCRLVRWGENMSRISTLSSTLLSKSHAVVVSSALSCITMESVFRWTHSIHSMQFYIISREIFIQDKPSESRFIELHAVENEMNKWFQICGYQTSRNIFQKVRGEKWKRGETYFSRPLQK